jgi:hypothetical protein
MFDIEKIIGKTSNILIRKEKSNIAVGWKIKF